MVTSNDYSSGDVVVVDRCHALRSAGADALGPIRVLVADGVSLFRGGLRALLEAEPGLAIAGEAASGQEVIALANETHPDVVLMDVELPGLDGVEVIRRIIGDPNFSELNVLIVTASELDEHLLGSLRAGATAYLSRDSEPGELVRAVRMVAAGEPVLSPRVARRVIAELVSHPDARGPSPDELAELTAREREVVALVAGGLSNDEIAERLVITTGTAKTHVSRALRKLDARNRAQLVTLAYETGLVIPQCRVVGDSPLGLPATLSAKAARALHRTRDGEDGGATGRAARGHAAAYGRRKDRRLLYAPRGASGGTESLTR
jgi:DNA-binding NarL/FixJ family response regulator